MIKNKLIIFIIILILCSCTPRLVPQPITSGIINPVDNSILLEKNSIRISARLQDMELAPYRMIDNVASFYFVIENLSDTEFSLPLESILLLDGEGNQYRPFPPSEVQQTITRDSTYLIPYPYVGFYYLEDQVHYSATSSFDNSLPYYNENYPQDIYTEALPVGTILPDAKISGVVYFLVDLYEKKNVEIRIYLPGSSISELPDFTFPFSVVNNFSLAIVHTPSQILSQSERMV